MSKIKVTSTHVTDHHPHSVGTVCRFLPVRGRVWQVVDLAAEAVVGQPAPALDPAPPELREAARPLLVAREGVGLARRPRLHLECQLGEALDGVALKSANLSLPRLEMNGEQKCSVMRLTRLTITHGQRVGLALLLVDHPKVLALRPPLLHQVGPHVVVYFRC